MLYIAPEQDPENELTVDITEDYKQMNKDHLIEILTTNDAGKKLKQNFIRHKWIVVVQTNIFQVRHDKLSEKSVDTALEQCSALGCSMEKANEDMYNVIENEGSMAHDELAIAEV